MAQSSRASRTSTSKPLGLLAKPGQVLLVIGGVRDGQEAPAVQPVGEEVVEHAAVLAAEHRVLGAALGDLRDVVGEDALEELLCLRPARLDLAHVRDVEHPGLRAHVHVLGADALVLHRHLPAGERHELGPGPLVAVEQGRAAEGVRCGRQRPAEAIARMFRAWNVSGGPSSSSACRSSCCCSTSRW